MVLWQAELRISWRAQWLSLLCHGVLVMLVLFLPWPLDFMPLWLLMLVTLVLGCVRSQRRINACCGELQFLDNGQICWQGSHWQFVHLQWMLRGGMMLVLRDESSGRKLRLCVMADSISLRQWRDLRRLVLTLTQKMHKPH